MKSLSNVGAERLGDALVESIDDGAKLSIISSYFTVFAYGELKEELSKIDEVRFLFSEPTFIKRMADSKEPREFEVARRAREVGVGGSGLELTLRNNLRARIPSTFKIDTPLGSYNPDWAYVEEADGERRVYFVTETKGGKNGEPALRDAEKIKIGCAKKHFEALDLGNDFHYNVRTTYQYEAVKA